jgi:phosphomevalonate kinase
MRIAVRAPGKAMLFGEYAVLDGAWGLVAAVDCHVTAWLHDGPPASPFVTYGATAAHDYLARLGRDAPAGWPQVDSSMLYAQSVGGGGRKLGLGSSASVTVASFGAVLHAADVPVDDPGRRHDIFLACDAAHTTSQGARGSGLDVAAAVWGGVLRARRHDEHIDVEPVALPPELAVVLVDTGVAASTAERVARYRSLDRKSPPVRQLLHHLEVLAERGAFATLASDLLILVEDWMRRMGELERLLGIDILTPALHRVAAVAREVDGCAKPSGAGGGDLAVAFIPVDAVEAFKRRLAAEDLPPLKVQIEQQPQGLQALPLSASEYYL